jgi:hypothetical protein
VHEPLNTKPLSPSEAALAKLLAEKSRRHEELQARGEVVTLQVIIEPGQSEEEAMALVEKPKGKVIDWIKRRIIEPEPSTVPPWKGQQVDPEAVAKGEAELEPMPLANPVYFWISIKHAAKDGSHAGEIREGLYHEVDGTVVVTSLDGKERIGSAPNTGDAIRVAREVLRKHHDGTKKKGWAPRRA